MIQPLTLNQPQLKTVFRNSAAGSAAAVGLAIFAAPVLICAGPVLAAAGMYAGDKAEDEINKAMDDKPEND